MRAFTFSLFALFISGCTFLKTDADLSSSTANDFKVDVTPRAPSSLPPGVVASTPKDLFAPPIERDAVFTCDELFGLLKRERPERIEDVLRLISGIRPKFLARSLYQYQTKVASEDASWLFPRVVTYGGDAKTILSFGGHPRRPGFERLNALCFNDKEKMFTAFDIVFPREAPSDAALRDLAENERKEKFVILSGERAATACANCSPGRVRPSVDTFALWPGFYGAVDDGLHDQDRPDMRPIYATYEYNQWRAFQAGPGSKGRYRFIKADLMRQNSDFTLKVSFVNGERLVGDLKRLGDRFLPHRWEFAKALLCTPPAPSRFFTQYDGATTVSATFNILPDESDAATKNIFLAAYYDQLSKERRLAEILNSASLPTPLPKEQFSALKLYYRDLFRPKDLNLDLRLSTVDVDEVLLVREIKRVMEPLGVDLENWSMVPGGGTVFENGGGVPGRAALRLILERAFVSEFFKEDSKLISAVAQREAAENALALSAKPSSEALKHANSNICDLVAEHLSPAPAKDPEIR